MTKGLTVSDVAESIHIHPTLSEAVMEAALKAGGEGHPRRQLIAPVAKITPVFG